MTELIQHWKQYAGYIGRRKMLILILMSLLVGVLDGLGISFIIPLLASSLGSENFQLPGYIQKIFSTINLEPNVWLLVTFIGVSIGGKSLLKLSKNFLSATTTASFIRKLRDGLVHLVSGIKYESYLNYDQSRFQSTATMEINKYGQSYSHYLDTLNQGFILTGYMVMAFMSSWSLTLILAGVGLLLNIVFSQLNKLAKRYSRELTTENQQYKGLLLELFGFYKYLKATARTSYFERLINKATKKFFRLKRNTTFLNGIPNVIQEPLTIVMILSVFYINDYFGKEPASVLIIVLAIAYRANAQLSQFQNYRQKFASSIGSIEEVNQLFGELKNAQEKPSVNSTPTFKNSITLQSVDFHYPNGFQALKKVTIELPRHKTIALVGKSGSGKSTTADILAGLIKPSNGQILLDNSPVDLCSKEWRTTIGYVTQESSVFNLPLVENILTGRGTKEDLSKEINKVLELTHAKEFTVKLTNNEPLGDRGSKLSGGQRQRIAFARELLVMPELLILDEATSALDNESEKVIKDSLLSIKGTTTTLIIAHRLSTVMDADIVYVFEEGTIIECGNPKELLKSESTRFRQLALQSGEMFD